MSQRQVLEHGIDFLNTLRGPAKLFFATSNAPMPSNLEQAVNATTGAPVTPWVAFGLTRGGINVSKTIDVTVRDDVDQIIGAYGQDITDRYYTLTTQLAEVLNRTQLAELMDLGTETIVVATATLPTQVMRLLDDGDNSFLDRRWMVVFPKATAGKLLAFVFRRGQISGGERVLRFDKTDPASPALEMRMFPEIATTIASEDAYGRLYVND